MKKMKNVVAIGLVALMMTWNPKKKTTLGAAYGVAFGVIIGVLTDNIGLWLSLGIAIGCGIGSYLDQQEKGNTDDSKE